MGQCLEVDICVIGAGSGGLSVAAGASQMGASVVLVEKAKMGGDCLNYGCVPSKALLAAGHASQAVRGASRFGVAAGKPQIDGRAVFNRVQGVIDTIAPHDSVERFEGLGVTVIQAAGRFVGPQELHAGDRIIKAKRFVVATGSRAFVPPIPGLDETPFLTNESLFERDKLPEHLLVIGGGPIGIEMAQAHRHLGSAVTVLEMASILPNDDPELVDVIRTRLLKEGVALREGVKVVGTAKTATGVAVTLEVDGQKETVEGTDLLVAAGRRPNVEGLDLEKAGIVSSSKGIEVDNRLRTANKKVFAIGDVAGGYQFTHVAGYHAGVVIKNALFRLPAKADYSAMPWVTFTAPELAHVGLSEKTAKETHGEIRILRWPFFENDRAQAEGETDGMIKVITTKSGKILGASIVGANAGELIQMWVLAIGQKMKIGAIASMIAPYPTLGEVGKRAAGSFFTPGLFSERTKKIVRFLLRFG